MFKRIAIVLFLILTITSAAYAFNEKQVATVIMWYTNEGVPHQMLVVDAAHWVRSDNAIVISKTKDWRVPNKILIGGMFNIVNYNYYSVFKKRTKKPELKSRFRKMIIEFGRIAQQHFRKPQED